MGGSGTGGGGGADDLAMDGSVGGAGGGGMKKLYVNEHNLKRVWEPAQRTTREDWSDWMRRVGTCRWVSGQWVRVMRNG
jgi:hypothetical protein